MKFCMVGVRGGERRFQDIYENNEIIQSKPLGIVSRLLDVNKIGIKGIESLMERR